MITVKKISDKAKSELTRLRIPFTVKSNIIHEEICYIDAEWASVPFSHFFTQENITFVLVNETLMLKEEAILYHVDRARNRLLHAKDCATFWYESDQIVKTQHEDILKLITDAEDEIKSIELLNKDK